MMTHSTWSARILRALVPAIPFLWLIVLFATPFLIVIKISLSEYAVAQPPYTPHFDWNNVQGFLAELDTENYSVILGVPLSSFIPVLIVALFAFVNGSILGFLTALCRWKGRCIILLILLMPYLLYGWAWLDARNGSTLFLELFHAFLYGTLKTPFLGSAALDEVMRFTALLIFATIPVFLSTGSLKKRHWYSEGRFSLKLAFDTLLRKGKGGLLLAFPAVFSAATIFMMLREFNGDRIYWLALLISLKIAVISTIILLIVGFPLAYAMARAPKSWRLFLIAAVMLPFWIVFLIRIYSWKLILEFFEHYLSEWGMAAGLMTSPLTLLNTDLAVYIGIIYGYLPFMVLPLYATLEKMDIRLVEAATDLGSPPWRTFWTITIPLAKPGILAGSLLCFIPAVGEFVIPELLGGSDTLMIGKTLWNEFFSNRDWPLASSVAVILLIILVIPMLLFQQVESGQRDRDAEEEPYI